MRVLSLVVLVAALAALAKGDLDRAKSAASTKFLETFETDVFTTGTWGKSSVDKYADQPVQIKTLVHPLTGFEGDKGLELVSDKPHQFYAVYSQLKEPLSFASSAAVPEFILQFELKLQEAIKCSGAYIKLPRVNPDGSPLDLSLLDNNTPYTVMFGADKCGTDANKVHLILQMQNPKCGLWEEKHATDVPTPKLDKKTHLYTLHIARDGSFEIFIDKKSVKKGSMLKDFKPPIQPEKVVLDPEDKKPSDWVDEAQMSDPADLKPEDWDEDQPRKVPDPNAKKPDNWDENAARQIPDPAAIKPQDWDDEEDGSWEAPLVDNPACDNPGCGPWSRPLIANPKYKGKWAPRKIKNPAFIGPWVQKNMSNPDYYEVLDPFSALPPVAALAIEVLTNDGGIHFDNLLIGTSLTDAFALADASFVPKSEADKAKEKKQKKQKTQKKINEKKAQADWRDKAEGYLLQASEFMQDNLIMAGVTTVAALIGLVYLFFFSAGPSVDAQPEPQPAAGGNVSSKPSRGAKSNAKEVKKAKEEEEEEEVEEEEEEEEVKVKSPKRGKKAASAKGR